MYFVGVTTAKSMIMRVFPKWARRLELGDCRIGGIDLALHDDAERYRQVFSDALFAFPAITGCRRGGTSFVPYAVDDRPGSQLAGEDGMRYPLAEKGVRKPCRIANQQDPF